jgi:hypothetical protein
VLSDTWIGIGLFQPFDGGISKRQAVADADRYVMTWGSDKPMSWRNGNRSISTGYYLPFDTDADRGSFGDLGHSLAWWDRNRPDWVLYQCDRKTPAWVGGLPGNVPLDISNPQVASYQMQLILPYMRSNGYTSLTVDVLSLQNGQAGCGVWTNGHRIWVPKFSGEKVDPLWQSAVLNWAGYVQYTLHRLRPQLPVIVNTPAWAKPGDPGEEALIALIDGFQDEAGFTGWGNHLINETNFVNKVWWAEYIQAAGKAYLVTDLWQGSEPNAAQRDFAVATYLMGKEHQAAMVTSQYGDYGVEHFWPEFQSPVGSPCAAMQGTQGVYERKYTGGLVIVNPTSATARVSLPKSRSSYEDMEGRIVTDPLTVFTDDGYVLLTSDGCQ